MNELKKLKIGYKEYDIERTSDVSKLSFEGSECYGRIDFNERKIYLNETRQEESTLIHEVLHGIDDMYEIDLTEKTQHSQVNEQNFKKCHTVDHIFQKNWFFYERNSKIKNRLNVET